MKILDSSVVVDLLVGRLRSADVGDEPVAAPYLIDSEVLHALRGMERGREIRSEDAQFAVSAFPLMDIRRYSAVGLHARIWELRHNLTAYDATYAALAESLDAPLLTRDGPLARAPGLRCLVEVV